MSARGLVFLVFVFASALLADPAPPAGAIQTVVLDSGRPYFLPTHPRVTTTVRFPGEIGAPDGAVSVFTEDAAAHPAEYLVSWQRGDAYFTLTPLGESRMANLNVPYQGKTYVLYFYPAADPLNAVAAVNLTSADSTPATAAPPGDPNPTAKSTSAAPPDIQRVTALPAQDNVAPTPARLLGFLDRLKLIHGTRAGPELASLTKAMSVQVAISREELGAAHRDRPVDPAADGIVGEIASGVNDAGWYQIVLLRVVRDRRLNCLGFICLVRNTSDRTLTFDPNSFGARAGAEYLSQRISDAAPVLEPGGQMPAYFVVQAPTSRPLLATNSWRVSVNLLQPRLNPGAVLSRSFGQTRPSP